MFMQTKTRHIIGLAWLAASLAFFVAQAGSMAVRPIAINALSDLLFACCLVLTPCVFLQKNKLATEDTDSNKGGGTSG